MGTGRPCTVCRHQDREAIDHALAAGEGFRSLAGRFGLTKQSLARHAANHVPTPAMRAGAVAAVAAEAQHGGSIIDQVRDLHRTALRLLGKAEAAGDLRTALAGVREAARCSELVAKLLGDLDESATVNVLVAPAFITVQAAILAALGPYPEARATVVRALEHVT